MKMITIVNDKEKKEQTRLFKPEEVLGLMQRMEYALPAYQVNLYELIENWNRLKATLNFYAHAPVEEIEKAEKEQVKTA